MVHRTFHDFDSYAESVRDADMRFILPRLEQPIWSICELSLGSLHVQFGTEGSGNIAEGAIREDGHIIYVQRSGTWGQANGVRLSPESIFSISPGAEFCIASEDAHDWFSVFIPTELLPFSCEAPPGVAQVKHGVLPISRRLNYIVDRLIPYASIQTDVFVESASQSAIYSEIMETVGMLFGYSCSAPSTTTGRPAIYRNNLISFAVALIEDCPHMSPTVKDLAVKTGVSERTLRSAFLDYFGVPPLKYMQVRRLHQARKLLREGYIDEVTVADVACKLGFWDLGRFASKYWRLFGERPSETLKINLSM